MDKALLDTDILSEIIKGRNVTVSARASLYRVVFSRYTFSAVTVLEIVKGFHRLGREDRLREFMEVLPAAEVLPLDTQSAEIAGRIYADLELAGQPIGRADPMIAGTALCHGLVLVTGNISHYERIRALHYPLRLDNWKN